MKEIVIISGKGGTGKTSVTAGFAAAMGNTIVADCDVDAPDLHILLGPKIKETYEYYGNQKADINPEKCSGCGMCAKLCKFDAIKNTGRTFNIEKISCEGCGVCAEFCPADAIEMKDCLSGKYFVSETRFATMVHALLEPAEENSGKLVAKVKKTAKEIGVKEKRDYLLVDGPPGIGCPVIASLADADLLVVVTEPGLSAMSDMERVVELAGHYKIPAAICINRFDINEELTEAISEKAKQLNCPVIGKIAYDDEFVLAQKQGECPVEFNPQSKTANQIKQTLQNALEILK